MGRGEDGCHGEGGADKLYGGPGADRLYGGTDFDHCDGTPGMGRSAECEAGPRH
jgi:Ca2+-binding RTX toxin-like protein